MRGPSRRTALVAFVVVGAVATACSAPTRPAAPTSGAPGGLTLIPLSADQINAIMGASAMAPGRINTTMVNPTFTLSPPDCSATLTVAEAPVYAGSGFTAVLEQRLQESGDARQHLVGQAVVTFPTADQAGAFVKSSAAKWKSCTGQAVTQVDPGKTVRWTVGDLTGTDTRIVQPHTRAEPADGWHCQHVLSAVDNVVLDVDACGFRVTDEGNQISDKLAANTKK